MGLVGTDVRRELPGADEDDIAEVIDWFATAAQRCASAGLDGVELHAGHGYLFDEFLSPASNTLDQYRWGGDVEYRRPPAVRDHPRDPAPSRADFPLWACSLTRSRRSAPAAPPSTT